MRDRRLYVVGIGCALFLCLASALESRWVSAALAAITATISIGLLAQDARRTRRKAGDQ